MDTPYAVLLQGASALALAAARLLGCALILPILGRRHMAGGLRSALCIALALPQAQLLWTGLQQGPQTMPIVVLGFKEVVIGAFLGCILALPFWAFAAAGTMIDNQRGANAAQQANPSLQADASILGELFERALIVYLIEIGTLVLVFDVIAASYRQWPPLAMLPELNQAACLALLAGFGKLVGSAMLFAAPALLLLLLAEYLLAVGSTVVQGVDVYLAAPIVKLLLALLMLLWYSPGLIRHGAAVVELWWMSAPLLEHAR